MRALTLPGVDVLPPPMRRQVALSQWFTPASVARRMAGLVATEIRRPKARVLEPSAGHGAIVDALVLESTTVQIDACEIDPDVAARITDDWRVSVHVGDYLAREAPPEPYTAAVMNPPYEGGLDGAFIAKAMDESRVVVALIRIAALCGKDRHERVWSRVESGSWNVTGLYPFALRPSFLAAGESSESAKSDFVVVRLTRVPGEPGVPMEWW